jgi:phosphatidylserine decarboxylase
MFSLFMPLLPKRALSRAWGWVERWQRPRWLVRWALKTFASYYRIDLFEAEKDLFDYRSLNDFFTRKLKSEVRPIQSDQVHPVDGVLTVSEKIVDGSLLQAKGWTYSLNELLGGGADLYEGGRFFTYYLCPTDYHRVHMPFDGEIRRIKHVVGRLWPVNGWSVSHVKGLFCQNERLIFEMETSWGQAALVMVGATNVGRMRVSFDESIQTNLRGASYGEIFERVYEPSRSLRVGDEIGVFEMGSTVILILNATHAAKIEPKSHPSPVRFGAPIGGSSSNV